MGTPYLNVLYFDVQFASEPRWCPTGTRRGASPPSCCSSPPTPSFSPRVQGRSSYLTPFNFFGFQFSPNKYIVQKRKVDRHTYTQGSGSRFFPAEPDPDPWKKVSDPHPCLCPFNFFGFQFSPHKYIVQKLLSGSY